MPYDPLPDPLRDAYRLALSHPENPLAPAVLALVDELARLQAIINSLADRVAAQSEALTRRAERDGARNAS